MAHAPLAQLADLGQLEGPVYVGNYCKIDPDARIVQQVVGQPLEIARDDQIPDAQPRVSSSSTRSSIPRAPRGGGPGVGRSADLGPEENETLRRYYPDRTLWLLEPDSRPPRFPTWAS